MPGKEQEAQQKLVLYQLLNQRIEQLNEQAKMIEQKLLELETTRQTLGDLKKLKQGNEVLIPLGSGCYTHGRTGDSGLLIDLGAGVMVRKAPEEAKKVIEDKKAEIERLSGTLQNEANDVITKMNEIGPELQKFLQKSKKEAKPGKPEEKTGQESAGAG